MSTYYRTLIRTNLKIDPHRIASLADGELLHECRIGCVKVLVSQNGNIVRVVSGDDNTGRDARTGCLMNVEQLDLFINSLIGLRAEAANRRSRLNGGQVQKPDGES